MIACNLTTVTKRRYFPLSNLPCRRSTLDLRPQSKAGCFSFVYRVPPYKNPNLERSYCTVYPLCKVLVSAQPEHNGWKKLRAKLGKESTVSKLIFHFSVFLFRKVKQESTCWRLCFETVKRESSFSDPTILLFRLQSLLTRAGSQDAKSHSLIFRAFISLIYCRSINLKFEIWSDQVMNQKSHKDKREKYFSLVNSYGMSIAARQ